MDRRRNDSRCTVATTTGISFWSAWVNLKVLVLLTVSQRLLILDTSTMQVTASCDLLMKQVLHHDRFSSHMTNFPAVADAYYPNFKTYKHKIMILVAPLSPETRLTLSAPKTYKSAPF